MSAFLSGRDVPGSPKKPKRGLGQKQFDTRIVCRCGWNGASEELWRRHRAKEAWESAALPHARELASGADGVYERTIDRLVTADLAHVDFTIKA